MNTEVLLYDLPCLYTQAAPKHFSTSTGEGRLKKWMLRVSCPSLLREKEPKRKLTNNRSGNSVVKNWNNHYHKKNFVMPSHLPQKQG